MKRIMVFYSSMVLACFVALTSLVVSAKEYPLPPPESRLIGERITYIVPNDGRSLEAIAAEYEVGLLALISANPGVDPLLPKAGSELQIPSLILLPDAPRKGIVMNLAELRLYYYPPDKNTVIVYPIGIGQLGRETPVTITRVIEKKANPTWTPTASIRRDYASRGIILPPVTPAGPDNPMGLFAIRLAVDGGTYLIHGTNANFGIGMRVSSGCIRLRPEDIEFLFNQITIGATVNIIHEPIKYAIEPDGQRYLEVHQPLSRTEDEDPQTMVLTVTDSIRAFLNDAATNTTLTEQMIVQRAGIPFSVNR